MKYLHFLTLCCKLRDFKLQLINPSESEFKEFKPRLKYCILKIVLDLRRFSIENRFWGDLRRGLNSLNSDTELIVSKYPSKRNQEDWCKCVKVLIVSNKEVQRIRLRC